MSKTPPQECILFMLSECCLVVQTANKTCFICGNKKTPTGREPYGVQKKTFPFSFPPHAIMKLCLPEDGPSEKQFQVLIQLCKKEMQEKCPVRIVDEYIMLLPFDPKTFLFELLQ